MRRIAPATRLTDAFSPPHHRPRARHLLPALILLMLLTGGTLVAISLAPGHGTNTTASAPVTLPDLLLATKFDQSAKTQSLWAYVPGSSAFQPVLDGSAQPVISPDGNQLVTGQVTRDDDTIHITVVALASDTLAHQWQTEVATVPTSALTQDSIYSVGASIAMTEKRVYVCPKVWGSKNSLSVAVLDRQNGRELTRWSIDLGTQDASSGPQLYVSPDGSSLYLLDSTFDPSTNQNTGSLYLRVDTTNGRLEDRHDLTSLEGQPFHPYGRMASDGQTLYSVGGWMPSATGALALQFFNLSTGTLQPSLTLPVQSANGVLDHEEASSSDGRTLYVLMPTAGQVAIVDVPSRTVTQVVPIEGLTAERPSLMARIVGALRGLVVQPAAAKFYFSGDMQLSPDGKRLYAVGVQGSGYEAMPTGVVAIDTTTWRVTDRWLSNAQVNFLQLGTDGHTLYVLKSDGSGQMSLTALDTTSGVASPVTSDLPGYTSVLPQLYRERYGTTPGGASSVTVPSKPVARLDIALDHTSILAGDAVTVDARFVDPGTDKPINQGQRNVRFEPPARVTATFYHGQIGAGDVVVQLQQVGYGHYRGSAVLKDPAVWSLRVDATRENAPGSRAELSSAVAVQSAFTATDGRQYMLELTTDPAHPVAGQQTIVQIAVVGAQSGTLLPDNVELTGGTPTSIDVAFFLGTGNLGQATEMISVTLHPAGHGRYQGTVSFDKSSLWAAQISFSQGDHAISTLAGAVQVKVP